MVDIYASSGVVIAVSELILTVVAALAFIAVAAAIRMANRVHLYHAGRLPLCLAADTVGPLSSVSTLVHAVTHQRDDVPAAARRRSSAFRAAAVVLTTVVVVAAKPVALSTIDQSNTIRGDKTALRVVDAAAFANRNDIFFSEGFISTAVDEVLAGAAQGAKYGDVCLAAAVGVRQRHDVCGGGIPRVLLRWATCEASAMKVQVTEFASGDASMYPSDLMYPFDTSPELHFVADSTINEWMVVRDDDGVVSARGEMAIAGVSRNKSRIVLIMGRLTEPHVRVRPVVNRTQVLAAEKTTCIYDFTAPPGFSMTPGVSRRSLLYRSVELWDLEAAALFAIQVLTVTLAHTRSQTTVTVYQSPVVVPMSVLVTTGVVATIAVAVVAADWTHGWVLGAGLNPDLSSRGLIRLVGHVHDGAAQAAGSSGSDVGGGVDIDAAPSAPHLVIVPAVAPANGTRLTVDTAMERVEGVRYPSIADVAPVRP